jgi:hypothetical protein
MGSSCAPCRCTRVRRGRVRCWGMLGRSTACCQTGIDRCSRQPRERDTRCRSWRPCPRTLPCSARLCSSSRGGHGEQGGMGIRGRCRGGTGHSHPSSHACQHPGHCDAWQPQPHLQMEPSGQQMASPLGPSHALLEGHALAAAGWTGGGAPSARCRKTRCLTAWLAVSTAAGYRHSPASCNSSTTSNTPAHTADGAIWLICLTHRAPRALTAGPIRSMMV